MSVTSTYIPTRTARDPFRYPRNLASPIIPRLYRRHELALVSIEPSTPWPTSTVAAIALSVSVDRRELIGTPWIDATPVTILSPRLAEMSRELSSMRRRFRIAEPDDSQLKLIDTPLGILPKHLNPPAGSLVILDGLKPCTCRALLAHGCAVLAFSPLGPRSWRDANMWFWLSQNGKTPILETFGNGRDEGYCKIMLAAPHFWRNSVLA